MKPVLLIACVLGLTAWARNASVDGAVLASSEITPRVLTGDTLSFAVSAGLPFIAVLPEAVGGRPIEAYESVRIPARSWRHHRAFFWQTTAGDRGEHVILFGVYDAGRIADTLTVIVDVSP